MGLKVMGFVERVSAASNSSARATVDADSSTAPEPMFNAPHGFYLTVTKPILDRMLACLGIVLLSPVIAVISAGVLVSSGRPIFFRQQRVGKDGQRFDIVKFRTMEPDRRRRVVAIDHPDRRKYHKSAEDPRHTGFGRLLRRFSLDELPQLINIVRGDMSLVGPRPELPDVVEQYEPWQHLRHLVRPGLTGPWQISARGDGPMHEFAHLDLQYISELSLRGDLVILSKTVPALITHQGH